MQPVDKLFEISAVVAAYYVVILITRRKSQSVNSPINRVTEKEKTKVLKENFDANDWGLIVGFILTVTCIVDSW